jgi:hypothetical protein
MMDVTRRTLGALVLASGLLGAPSAGAADPIGSVEDAYALRHLRHTRFDPRAAPQLAPEESRFLEAFFVLTDEAVLLNTEVGRWFSSRGAEGLHAAAYLEGLDALRARLEALETPQRVESVCGLVAESLALQRAFVAEWREALEEGRAFESQLTDEFAYHEGLHRSNRLLLKAFAELHALFPDAGERTHMAFHDHLRALDLR